MTAHFSAAVRTSSCSFRRRSVKPSAIPRFVLTPPPPLSLHACLLFFYPSFGRACSRLLCLYSCSLGSSSRLWHSCSRTWRSSRLLRLYITGLRSKSKLWHSCSLSRSHSSLWHSCSLRSHNTFWHCCSLMSHSRFWHCCSIRRNSRLWHCCSHPWRSNSRLRHHSSPANGRRGTDVATYREQRSLQATTVTHLQNMQVLSQTTTNACSIPCSSSCFQELSNIGLMPFMANLLHA